MCILNVRSDSAILKAKKAYAAIAAQAKKKKEEQNRQSSRTEIAKAITTQRA